MTLRKLKFLQHSFIKKTLLLVYDSYWWIVQHLLKNDKCYLSYKYWTIFHKKLNWKHPKTFNEKLQWLKLYGHRPEYVTMADKYRVKKYVADIIGEEYVVPCLGVWDNADEIDINSLPEQFVLKCNHNSGGIEICRDKSSFDFAGAKKRLNDCLKKGYYLQGRDKQYRDIQKKVLADAFLDDGREGELQDYKFWCFNGTPKYMYMTNKGRKIMENFYDMDFDPVMIDHGFERHIPEYDKPAEFEKMRNLAAQLSQGIPFVRVDFFDVNHHIYFGEFTFFDWGGWRPFKKDWDLELGKLLDITEINGTDNNQTR